MTRYLSVAFILMAVTLSSCGVSEESNVARKTKSEPPPQSDGVQALIGKKAPELIGSFGVNGKAVSLADLRGQVVLVDFWAVWCNPCIKSFPHLREWYADFHDQGFEVLGVTTYYKYSGFDKEKGLNVTVGKVEIDPETGKEHRTGGMDENAENEMLKDFVRHHKLSYPIITLRNDEYQRTERAFNIEGYPTMILIDRLGKVRWATVGVGADTVEVATAEIKKLVDER